MYPQTNKQKIIYFYLILFLSLSLACIHKQTNYLNNYLILINLICEFVCGFCGHTKKEKKQTYRPVYWVAVQLKINA